jgi:hypothetical protein
MVVQQLNRINTLNKLLYSTSEMIYSLKYMTPFYNSQYLRNTAFILNNYYLNNNNDWVEYVNANNYNEFGYNKTKIHVNNVINNVNISINCNIITWSPYSRTDFHGHKNIECLMIPLRGKLKQDVIYSDIYNSLLLPKSHNNIYKSNTIYSGETSYIDDDIGHHRITNDNDRICVSLHLYYGNDDNDLVDDLQNEN